MKKVLTILAGMCLTLALQAQNIYDPLTAGYEVQVPAMEDAWNAVWMWHPGQLSAHLQQVNLAASKGRCTYVGYPGNFYKPADVTSFRKTVSLKAPATLR